MIGYVVDASVAVKWLVTEAFSDEAVVLLSQKPESECRGFGLRRLG
jgi:predicted nucleic acid-binding protein